VCPPDRHPRPSTSILGPEAALLAPRRLPSRRRWRRDHARRRAALRRSPVRAPSGPFPPSSSSPSLGPGPPHELSARAAGCAWAHARRLPALDARLVWRAGCVVSLCVSLSPGEVNSGRGRAVCRPFGLPGPHPASLLIPLPMAGFRRAVLRAPCPPRFCVLWRPRPPGRPCDPPLHPLAPRHRDGAGRVSALGRFRGALRLCPRAPCSARASASLDLDGPPVMARPLATRGPRAGFQDPAASCQVAGLPAAKPHLLCSSWFGVPVRPGLSAGLRVGLPLAFPWLPFWLCDSVTLAWHGGRARTAPVNAGALSGGPTGDSGRGRA